MTNITAPGSSIELPSPTESQPQPQGADAVIDPASCDGPELPSAVARFLKGKEREIGVVRKSPGPLHIFDLPVDILRLIVKEITHTNDLTALALTNSMLYSLSVPHIYSRFDIVWPDTAAPASDSKNVDALTYGLSTLCLGSKFAQRTRWLGGHALGDTRFSQRLADNQYAKYTRKFSIGNGPEEWISEYMMNKESGKMLSTLVALAVAKMVNLETFVWDMPTGVSSDIFMAMASIQDHCPEGDSKLEKLWVRWHSNEPMSSTVSSPAQTQTQLDTNSALPSNNNAARSESSAHRMVNYSESQVEYPTFSILPPLKSLTVLDIDEVAYLDEMSILIKRSESTLTELQVGVAQKAVAADFVTAYSGPEFKQVDHEARWPGESCIGNKRLGGVLGILVGRIHNLQGGAPTDSKQVDDQNAPPPPEKEQDEEGSKTPDSSHDEHATPTNDEAPKSPVIEELKCPESALASPSSLLSGPESFDGKLKLQRLALERVELSKRVCQKVIDWTVLTDLTILDCREHESLWKVLRKQYQPTRPHYNSAPKTQTQYHLALKRIHTDATSRSLISFLKETLAPNSLEVLFLQERRYQTEGVKPMAIGHIFKSAIKRHRLSLKKLLVDSSDKSSDVADPQRWKHWALTSEAVAYITSRQMKNLRELSISIDYKDWHTFLQRLPGLPHLRSLYISHVYDSSNSERWFEPRDLAMQIMSIVALRPDIPLCYLGIESKCFEILENNPRNGDQYPFGQADDSDDDGGEVDDEVDMDQGSVGDDGTGDEEEAENANSSDTDEESTGATEDAISDGDSSQDDGSVSRLRLREILFYDDKVAIFKARHARL